MFICNIQEDESSQLYNLIRSRLLKEYIRNERQYDEPVIEIFESCVLAIFVVDHIDKFVVKNPSMYPRFDVRSETIELCKRITGWKPKPERRDSITNVFRTTAYSLFNHSKKLIQQNSNDNKIKAVHIALFAILFNTSNGRGWTEYKIKCKYCEYSQLKLLY